MLYLLSLLPLLAISVVAQHGSDQVPERTIRWIGSDKCISVIYEDPKSHYDKIGLPIDLVDCNDATTWLIIEPGPTQLITKGLALGSGDAPGNNGKLAVCTGLAGSPILRVLQ